MSQAPQPCPERPSALSRFRLAQRRSALPLHALTRSEVSLYLPFVQTYEVDGWTALGDPTRRAIFERIADRPRAVGELAGELPVSRPAVSQHLKVLKNAGLVMDRADGTRRIYRLRPDGLGALRADLDRFWTQALAAYKAVVEQPTEEAP
jgi:DNA-binding transcriptional ArsR family regulator